MMEVSYQTEEEYIYREVEFCFLNKMLNLKIKNNSLIKENEILKLRILNLEEQLTKYQLKEITGL